MPFPRIWSSSPSRRAALAAVVALPLLPGPSLAASPSPVAEVTALVLAQQAAWNRGDIAGFCQLYSDDCIFVTPSGLTRGRSVVQEHFTKKYGMAKETMGRLRLDILDSRETVAMVTMAMRWTLTWDGNPSGKAPAAGHTLIVWQRQAAGWRLVQDASM